MCMCVCVRARALARAAAADRDVLQVYDFGGGTLDVSLLQKDGGVFTVVRRAARRGRRPTPASAAAAVRSALRCNRLWRLHSAARLRIGATVLVACCIRAQVASSGNAALGGEDFTDAIAHLCGSCCAMPC